MTPTLADAIFWVAVVACAIAQVGILRATAVARAAAPAKGGAQHRHATRVEETLWAALPVIALAGVLYLTWQALHPGLGAGVAPAQAGGSAA